MYEAKRWHDDKRFYTPMIVLDCGKHLFIGDFVKIKGYDINLRQSGKVCSRGNNRNNKFSLKLMPLIKHYRRVLI